MGPNLRGLVSSKKRELNLSLYTYVLRKGCEGTVGGWLCASQEHTKTKSAGTLLSKTSSLQSCEKYMSVV